MGDMADDWFEHELLQQLAREGELSHRFDNDEWTTSDGRVIPLSEMTENHLRNTIRFIKRRPGNIPYDEEWLPKLQRELGKRIDSRWVI